MPTLHHVPPARIVWKSGSLSTARAFQEDGPPLSLGDLLSVPTGLIRLYYVRILINKCLLLEE